jgi:hypothetical protein
MTRPSDSNREQKKRRNSRSRTKAESDVRIAGRVIHGDGTEEILVEAVRPAKGLGRWIYCKYCHMNVKPMLSGINQIVCSRCEHGLTPDFFVYGNLLRWLSGDESALTEDKQSPAAKAWLESRRQEDRRRKGRKWA